MNNHLESNSTRRCEVVPVRLEPHPNADTLSLVQVYGYQVCVRTADWVGVDRGVYLPPESVVPDTEQFAFLDSKRIKVKRLRGIVSMGLLVRAPEGAELGADLAEALGVTHYEPPFQASGGEATSPPRGHYPNYDVESARRYGDVVFSPGEPVWVTEKIHGASGRWLFDGEKIHAGSRTEWKRFDETNLWWKALAARPEIETWLRENPGFAVYGEVYGQVQDLKYGKTGADIAVFDIMHSDGKWAHALVASDIPSIRALPWVPGLGIKPYDVKALAALAEGDSLVPGADHIREGVVIKPLEERTHPQCGRVNLKIIGNGYLERR